jgi:hypothetical protein
MAFVMEICILWGRNWILEHYLGEFLATFPTINQNVPLIQPFQHWYQNWFQSYTVKLMLKLSLDLHYPQSHLSVYQKGSHYAGIKVFKQTTCSNKAIVPWQNTLKWLWKVFCILIFLFVERIFKIQYNLNIKVVYVTYMSWFMSFNFCYSLVLEILLNFIIIELLFYVSCMMCDNCIISCLNIYVLWHVLHPMASFSQKGSIK